MTGSSANAAPEGTGRPEAGLDLGASEQPGPCAGQIDWDALNRRFAGSPGLVARLARAALESESESAAQLRAIAAAGDLDAFFRKTHALKGLAANLCAEPLREEAHRCCEQARAGDAQVLDCVEALAKQLEALLDELAEVSASASSSVLDAGQ